MDVSPEWEDNFNYVYSYEHQPYLRQVPGIITASRYRVLPSEFLGNEESRGFPRYVAIYELEIPEIVGSPVWFEARDKGQFMTNIRPHTQNHCRASYNRVAPTAGKVTPTKSNIIIMARSQTSKNSEAEFSWVYDTRQVPSSCLVPGVISGSRYEDSGAKGNHLTIYEADSIDVLSNETWRRPPTWVEASNPSKRQAPLWTYTAYQLISSV